MSTHSATPAGVKTKLPMPLFRLAFRPFFWFSALFGVISIALWALSFSGEINFFPYGGSYFWHLHEMLFGFTAAVVVGFLLTAVQNWTGVPSVKGVPLALLFFLWLCARIMMLLPGVLSPLIIAIADLLFLPAAALAMARPIIRVRLWRNLFFIPILLGMAVLNGLMHASVTGILPLSFQSLSYLMVLLVSLVMCVMGGRVFPMFTANGTGTARVAPIALIEKLSVASVVVSILVSVEFFNLPDLLVGVTYLVTGIINLLRAIRWKIWVTWSTPLVWSLHLSYWMLCVGYLLLGLTELKVLTGSSTALHALTVGGIGFMILAMMSRVSLGHSGRPIVVGKTMTLAFVLLALSAVCRVFLPYVVNQYTLVIQISALLWVAAFGTFVVRYAPVLFRARVDGKNG